MAKDYSQPEVRRQQDEDKRLRLQVKHLRLLKAKTASTASTAGKTSEEKQVFMT